MLQGKQLIRMILAFQLAVIGLISLSELSFDISVLRIIVGSIYLTFVPGLLILHILGLNQLSFLEEFVLSIGLSISFTIFFGLIINNTLFAFGYTKPLSSLFLLVSFGTVTIILSLIAYLRNRNNISYYFSVFKLNTREKVLLLVPSLFPLLSITGTQLMNTANNNTLLMLLLLLVPAYLVLVSLFNRNVSEKLYPVVIFLISISLLLILPLRSSHIIIWSDTGRELLFFRLTSDNLHWTSLGHELMNSCLSISLLPTIYQSLLSVTNQESLFKFLYPFVFSISPLIIYRLSSKYIGSFYAFLSSAFFIFQVKFLQASSVIRTNIAIFFFALVIMVLFHKDISGVIKKILLLIFLLSVIVSHYAASYILLIVLLLAWFGKVIFSKFVVCKGKPAALKNLAEQDHIDGGCASNFPMLREGITITIVIIFFTFLFLWYSEATGRAFEVGVWFVRDTITNLKQFFSLESRGAATALFGQGLSQIPQKIELGSTWISLALIGVGVLSLVYRALRRTKSSRISGIKSDFEVDYIVMTLVCTTLLLAVIALPRVAIAYTTTRTFLMMTVILSPCFVLGGLTLSKKLFPQYIGEETFFSLIILIVLILYFMCTSGTIYQLFGVPKAITLNSQGDYYNLGRIIRNEEIYASKWLARYCVTQEKIYTTGFGGEVLMGQGKISPSRVDIYLIPRYEKNQRIEGYIYLRYQDIPDRKIIVWYPSGEGEQHSLDEYLSMLSDRRNKLYESGGSQVYY